MDKPENGKWICQKNGLAGKNGLARKMDWPKHGLAKTWIS
jgi:hypothetical protein